MSVLQFYNNRKKYIYGKEELPNQYFRNSEMNAFVFIFFIKQRPVTPSESLVSLWDFVFLNRANQCIPGCLAPSVTQKYIFSSEGPLAVRDLCDFRKPMAKRQGCLRNWKPCRVMLFSWLSWIHSSGHHSVHLSHSGESTPVPL